MRAGGSAGRSSIVAARYNDHRCILVGRRTLSFTQSPLPTAAAANERRIINFQRRSPTLIRAHASLSPLLSISRRFKRCRRCRLWINFWHNYRGWALDRVHSSRRPVDRVLALFDPVSLTFDLILIGGRWARYRDRLSLCQVWWLHF